MTKKVLVAVGILFLSSTGIHAQSGNSSTNSKSLGFIEGFKFSLPSFKAPEKKDTVKSVSKAITNSLKQTLSIAIETFLPFQFKYAILLNESVEKVTNVVLYKTIDEWYGTRYRMGGQTTKGIDCSAFMQVLSNYAFGLVLPRTAREQFASMETISKDDIKEGDYVFFNTRGGISHVGMYLQNNKFVHSSSSQGVCIGDLDDKYWSVRFLGAKRATADSLHVSANTISQLN